MLTCNTLIQDCHRSLTLGLKHCPVLLPTEVLNGLQALGLLCEERKAAREKSGEREKRRERKRREHAYWQGPGEETLKRWERRLKKGQTADVRARLRANASRTVWGNQCSWKQTPKRTDYCCWGFQTCKSQCCASKIPSTCRFCNERGEHAGPCLQHHTQCIPGWAPPLSWIFIPHLR